MNAKELLGRLCENAICGESSVYECGDGAYMRLIKGAAESDFLKSAASAKSSAIRFFSATISKKTDTHHITGICSSTYISARRKKACASYATRSRLGSSARSRNTREDAAALCGSLKTTTRILTAGCAISCAARTTAFLL